MRTIGEMTNEMPYKGLLRAKPANSLEILFSGGELGADQQQCNDETVARDVHAFRVFSVQVVSDLIAMIEIVVAAFMAFRNRGFVCGAR